MKIGYVRVSTKEQNTARQEEIMKSLGVDKVYIDRMSGRDTERPALQEIKDFYKAVSEVQELYVNIANLFPVERTANEVRQSAGVYTNKITSLSELSKLYENDMLTKEEFEQLKQEVIGSQ